jgi:hypothetical protein
VPPGVSLVDELLADRRAEVHEDEAELVLAVLAGAPMSPVKVVR